MTFSKSATRQDIPPKRPSADLLSVLGEMGYRPTSQRRSVVDRLQTKTEGFTAEELSQELPQVGRATVYRTIKLLLEADILCKLPMANGAPKYMLAVLGHHHHTICVECDTVGEFSDKTVESALELIATDVPGRVVNHRMDIYFICNNCLTD